MFFYSKKKNIIICTLYADGNLKIEIARLDPWLSFRMSPTKKWTLFNHEPNQSPLYILIKREFPYEKNELKKPIDWNFEKETTTTTTKDPQYTAIWCLCRLILCVCVDDILIFYKSFTICISV